MLAAVTHYITHCTNRTTQNKTRMMLCLRAVMFRYDDLTLTIRVIQCLFRLGIKPASASKYKTIE